MKLEQGITYRESPIFNIRDLISNIRDLIKQAGYDTGDMMGGYNVKRKNGISILLKQEKKTKKGLFGRTFTVYLPRKWIGLLWLLYPLSGKWIMIEAYGRDSVPKLIELSKIIYQKHKIPIHIELVEGKMREEL